MNAESTQDVKDSPWSPASATQPRLLADIMSVGLAVQREANAARPDASGDPQNCNAPAPGVRISHRF